MAPVPKKKHTRSRSNIRRKNKRHTKLPDLSVCPSCGELKTPHAACSYCGFYKSKKK